MINSSNRVIAQNTFYLYLRMAFTLLIGLYSTRLLLRYLGIEDYGIYNVVSGVVSFVGFLKSAMSNGFQRYYNVAMVQKDKEILQRLFSVSSTIILLIALLILIIAETLGLWIINTQLLIPPNRIFAANLAYQGGILVFLLTLINSPYNAIIIAYEKMNLFAVISIAQAVLKLIIIVILSLFPDRLIAYSFLLIVVDVFVLLGSYFVVHKLNSQLSMRPIFDRLMMNNMLSFTGWNLFGSFSHVFKGQGINMILNMFFGPVVNAARGVAFQVSGALSQFYSNFQLASRPQIIKYYAKGQIREMCDLVNNVSRFSFLLMWIISLPFLFSANWIINLWLGENAPELASEFVIIVILTQIVGTLSTPISNIVHATGKMKTFQILIGMSVVAIVPVAYIVLILGGSPSSALYVSLIMSILIQAFRVYMVNKLVRFSWRDYLRSAILPCIYVVTVSSIFLLFIKYQFNELIHPFVMVLCSFCIGCLSSFFIGCKKSERDLAINKIKSRLSSCRI